MVRQLLYVLDCCASLGVITYAQSGSKVERKRSASVSRVAGIELESAVR